MKSLIGVLMMTAYFEEYSDFLTLMKEFNRNVYDLIRWMDQGGKEIILPVSQTESGR